jgi:lysophospholipase L1-like esterase
LSWATGLDDQNRVISHARRLRFLNPKLKIYNAAISGAAADLVDENEVLKLNKWAKKNFKKEYPDYVTLLVGPNDICGKMTEPMTSDSDFYNRVYNSIRKIVDGNPDSKVLISSIPNIGALRDVTKDAPAFNNSEMNTCLKVWKKIAFCENVELAEEHEEVYAKVETFNKILKDIAFEQNQRVAGDRVRVADSIYRYRFTADDLAVDCFHPNYMAQNMLADLTFEESWWAKQYDQVKESASTQFAKEKKEAQKRRADAARAASGAGGKR